MDALGWIIAAFLAGILLACVFHKPQKLLRRRLAGIECYRGLSSRQIINAIHAEPDTIIQLPDGQSLMVWKDRRYTMILRFNSDHICLGVEEEKENMPCAVLLAPRKLSFSACCMPNPNLTARSPG